MKTLAILTLALFAFSSAQLLRGVNWGHRIGYSGNDANDCKPPSQFEAEFKYMSTYAQAVKIYSCGECLAGPQSLKYSKQFGLKLFVGLTADPQWFGGDFDVLKSMVDTYGFEEVLGVSIGSEDLYRGDVPAITADSISGQIKQVQAYLRSKGYSTPVTHVDAIGATDPRWGDIRSVQDIYMYNYFPFWMGIHVNGALGATIGAYNDIKANYAQGKPVWIGEVGWPTGGYNKGDAVADEDNSGVYYRQFICWANANNIPYFYYEAFDEPWKLNAVGPTGPIEANFGTHYFNGTAKSFVPGLVCDGRTTVTPIPKPPTQPPPTTSSTFTTSSTSTTSSTFTTSSTTSTVAPKTTSSSNVVNTNNGNNGNSGNNGNNGVNTSPVVTPTSNDNPTPDNGNNNNGNGNTVGRDQGSASSVVVGVATLAAVALLL